MLDVIGQDGWYPCGGKRAIFDQQPVDALAMVQACVCAHQHTGKRATGNTPQPARCQPVWRALYDPSSGGFDGLHPDRVNGNQGAESTLAYLLSRLAFEVSLVPKACRHQPVTEAMGPA